MFPLRDTIPSRRAPVVLWLLLLANLGLTLFTKRTLGITYFLPLYAVLPLWTGELLGWLWGIRRALGATALAALLGFNVWATWSATRGRRAGRPGSWPSSTRMPKASARRPTALPSSP